MSAPQNDCPLAEIVQLQQRCLLGEAVEPLIEEVLQILLRTAGASYGCIWELVHSDEQSSLRPASLAGSPPVLPQEPIPLQADETLEALALEGFTTHVLYCGEACVGVAGVGPEDPGIGENEAVGPVLAAVAHLLYSGRKQRQEQEAMAALRTSEDRLEFAVRASTDGLWDWNLRTDHVYFSARWQEMLGFEEGEIPPEPGAFFGMIHPDDIADVSAAAEAHRRGETEWYGVEFRMRHKDGSWRWILARGRIRNHPDDGEPWRFMGTHVDITEARQHAEALQRAKEEAESTERVRAAFLANITHELRTPLNAIINATHLAGGSPLTEEQRELLGIVETASAGLLTIINDVLDLSKFESEGFRLQPKPFELAELLRRSVRVITPLAQEKDLDFSWQFSPELPTFVLGAANRIHQVLSNLLSNAVKYTDRGSVRFVVRPSDRPNHVRFEVQDTGIGLDPQAQAQVFLPFRQVEEDSTRSFGGTGLGLAIVHKLVERMGGEIELESVLGQGSTFSVELPLPRAASSAASEAATPRGLLFGRVLLVEDNPVNRLLMLKVLDRGTQLHVDVATDGAEAIRKASKHDYSLILMDCQMPGTDGFQATRAIRELSGRRGRVPIIAQTASAFSEDREACIDAGMDDFLAKPIQPHELFSVLSRWLPCGAEELSAG